MKKLAVILIGIVLLAGVAFADDKEIQANVNDQNLVIDQIKAQIAIRDKAIRDLVSAQNTIESLVTRLKKLQEAGKKLQPKAQPPTLPEPGKPTGK